MGNEFAWRAHEAIQGWTTSVDAKASIVLIVETAVAGAAANALITADGELHTAIGLHLATAISAMVALILAVACALWVVFPRLERRRTAAHSKGLIYFGHLSRSTPEQIASALEQISPRDEARQLARQLHITSQVAWRKHVWLQRSVALLVAGAILLVLSFVAF